MTKLIEAVHSTYGLIKLRCEKSDYGTIQFFRSDDSFMGEMDRDSGGMLSHPNLDTNKFLCAIDKNLLEVDERGYIELEDTLYEEADKAYPGFFVDHFPSIP